MKNLKKENIRLQLEIVKLKNEVKILNNSLDFYFKKYFELKH